MSEGLKPKHGEWWLGKWSGTFYNAVMQYNGDKGKWHDCGLEAFQTDHSFKPIERLYGKSENDRLEQENADLRKALYEIVESSKMVRTKGNEKSVKDGLELIGSPKHYTVSLSSIHKAKELLNK